MTPEEELEAVTFGSIQLHSLCVNINLSARDWVDAMKLVDHDLPRLPEGVSPRVKHNILTYYHEIDHFDSLISCPMGLLIWRLYVVIEVGMTFALQKLQKVRINVDSKDRSFSSWFRESGQFRLLLKDKGARGPTGPLVHYLTHDVLPELEGAERLLSILLCSKPHEQYKDLSIGEFLELINDLYPRIARRSGLPWNRKWDTNLPKSHKLFNDGAGCDNARCILEILAQGREETMARDPFAEIVEERASKYHRTRRKAIFPVSQSSSAARSALRFALLGHVDVAGHESSGALLIEDHWPWFRGPMMISNIVGEGVALNRRAAEEDIQYLRSLVRSRLWGVDAEWTILAVGDLDLDESEEVKARLLSGDLDLYSFHHLWVRQCFRKGLSEMARFLTNILDGNPTPDLIQTSGLVPMIRFPDMIYWSPRSDYLVSYFGFVSGQCYTHLLTSCLAVLKGRPIVDDGILDALVKLDSRSIGISLDPEYADTLSDLMSVWVRTHLKTHNVLFLGVTSGN